MALIPFPNVPLAPGVPDVPRYGPQTPWQGTPYQLPAPLTSGATTTPLTPSAQWGIYDATGSPIWQSQDEAVVLSTYAFEFIREARIADFQVEEGSFASYNKVNLPGNPTVTVVLGGNPTSRAAFLTTMEAASKSTALYSVVTPDATYANYNIERYRYGRRASKGCTLLLVEISLKELRQVSAAYSTQTQIVQPQDAGATPQTNSGMVQPTAPPTSVLKSLGNIFPSLVASQ
jgi:hypothetical protein